MHTSYADIRARAQAQAVVRYYTLSVDNTPVPCSREDYLLGSETGLFNLRRDSVVGPDNKLLYSVSTVFLGIDPLDGLSAAPPFLFEIALFTYCGQEDNPPPEMRRTPTLWVAQGIHDRWLSQCRRAAKKLYPVGRRIKL